MNIQKQIGKTFPLIQFFWQIFSFNLIFLKNYASVKNSNSKKSDLIIVAHIAQNYHFNLNSVEYDMEKSL